MIHEDEHLEYKLDWVQVDGEILYPHVYLNKKMIPTIIFAKKGTKTGIIDGVKVVLTPLNQVQAGVGNQKGSGDIYFT